MRFRLGVLSWLLVALSAFAESGFDRLPELPAELLGAHRPAGDAESILSDTVEFGEVQFENHGHNTLRAFIPGTKSLQTDAAPEVPYLEKVYDIDEEMEAQPFLMSAQALKTSSGVPLEIQPDTLFWTSGFRIDPPAKTRFFPGQLVRGVRSGRELHVQYFPVQWDRNTGEVIRIQKMGMQVFGTPTHREKKPFRSANPGIILTPEAFLDGARLLQSFQMKHSGVASDILTMEAIAASETEIPEKDLPEGYKNPEVAAKFIVGYDARTGAGYNYSLARKISNYLQRSLRNSSLKYVTILGDAVAVPPSYYFSVPQEDTYKVTVTDECYAAVSQCTEPRAAIGRLPLQSVDEVKNYLAKLERWLNYAPKATSELSIYGGKAFGGPFYIGELAALRALPDDADWVGVHKNFRTNRLFNRANVLEMFRGNTDSSFVYYLDHGKGNKVAIERTSIRSKEIFELQQSGSTVNPVIFAVSCSNAAFDEAFFVDDVFQSPRAGNQSVGVASLRSKAGAVAYIGAGRPALGSPQYSVDEKGNLDLTGSTHTLKILDSALESYRQNGEGRLGDYVRESLAAFAVDPSSNISEPRFRWSYFNLVLLGDPTMKLPARKRHEIVKPVAEMSDVLEKNFRGKFPALFLSKENEGTLHFQSSVNVKATLFEQGMRDGRIAERKVTEGSFGSGDWRLPFVDKKGQRVHFMRIENTEGVPLERQVWFWTR